MNPIDLICKFQSALPVVREWIDRTLEENRPNAVSVNTLTFPQLSNVLPLDLLSRAQVVVVTGKVPWERLGVDDFLLAYGAGLMQFGYRNSPLEKMAYFLQSGFDRGVLPENTIEFAQQGTDAIWSGLSSMLSEA